MCVCVYMYVYEHKVYFVYLSVKNGIIGDSDSVPKLFVYFDGVLLKEKKRNKDNFKGSKLKLKQNTFVYAIPHPEQMICLKKNTFENPCVFFFDNLILLQTCQIFRKEYGR